MMQRLLTGCALLCAALLLLPQASTAQNVDNAGKEFVVGFLPNTLGGNIAEQVQLHLTSSEATMVQVDYPVNSPTFTTTVAVNPGDVTIVTLPQDASTGWTPDVVENRAVRAVSTDNKEFIAYMINRRTASSDAALALPVDALNTDYIAQTYTPVFVAGQFNVVAAFNDTEVEITPSNNINGHTAGTAFSITLDKGEGYYARSQTTGASGDLSGSLIKADKPVFVANGNGCTQVPNGVTACDHIFEVAHPLASWGDNVFVAPLPQRTNGTIYRVLASEDGTSVTLDGAAFASLNAGEFMETGQITGAHVFSADKPIFVTQYMPGDSNPGATDGDPAMGNMIPSEQYLEDYTFSTVGGGQFASNFVSIIANNADVTAGTILLDGTAVPSGDFTSIPGTSWSYAIVLLDEGTHTTSSGSEGHGITVEGYNSFDSYIYPGGARFSFINQQDDTDPPVCELNIVSNTSGQGKVTDDGPDDRGVFFVELGAGSTNLKLDVAPFTPGDPMVTYTVMLDDISMDGMGTVVGTDGAGNTCSSSVEFKVGDDPPPPPPDECDDPDTQPSWDGSVVENGGMKFLPIAAPTGLSSLEFYNTTNFQVDAIADANFNDITADFSVSGMMFTYVGAGDPPTLVHVKVSAPDAGSSRFFLRAMDECDRTVDLDPEVALDVAAPGEAGFALDQNYPNPVRSTTAIRFTLGASTSVTLSVYDVTGREVARLIDQTMGAGSHEVSWDGRDGSGRTLAAGLYLYQIEAGSFSQTRRLTLVK